ncbi:MAG: orotate phosphoribosyltransferase [Terracoccus sp.]
MNAPNPTHDVAAARARLLEIITERAIVHGRVILSSGKEADYYVDLRRISLDGEAAPLVGVVMRELTRDLTYAAVGGLTLGADPVATAMLHAAAAAGERLDAFVVRKAGKAHGLQQRIEGPSIKGRNVLVVEDTTTTGASPLDAVAAVRDSGATPVAVATIADRATGAGARIEAEGVEYRFVYSLDELGLA